MPRGRNSNRPIARPKPVEIDGHKFASKREGKRYCELKLLQAAGLIKGLELQPRFVLSAANGEKVGEYIADFRYLEQTKEGWVSIVEDTKGFKTDIYRWKKRHMRAEYHIEIRET